MLRVRFVAIVLLAVMGGQALGQSAVVPGAGFPPVQNDLARRHRGPTGSPCLAVQGYAKTEIVNKDIFQHWIRVTNSCAQAIKVRVCYYQSEHCIDVDVPALDKKDSVLGIFPALKRFQFEAKEQF